MYDDTVLEEPANTQEISGSSLIDGALTANTMQEQRTRNANLM